MPLAPRVEALEIAQSVSTSNTHGPTCVYGTLPSPLGPQVLPPLAVGKGYTHIQWAFLMLLVPTDCSLKFSRFQHAALSDKNAFCMFTNPAFALVLLWTEAHKGKFSKSFLINLISGLEKFVVVLWKCIIFVGVGVGGCRAHLVSGFSDGYFLE